MSILTGFTTSPRTVHHAGVPPHVDPHAETTFLEIGRAHV